MKIIWLIPLDALVGAVAFFLLRWSYANYLIADWWKMGIQGFFGLMATIVTFQIIFILIGGWWMQNTRDKLMAKSFKGFTGRGL